MNLVNYFVFGVDDFIDFVYWDVNGNDVWSSWGYFIGRIDGFVYYFKDCGVSFFSLFESIGEYVGRDFVEFGV